MGRSFTAATSLARFGPPLLPVKTHQMILLTALDNPDQSPSEIQLRFRLQVHCSGLPNIRFGRDIIGSVDELASPLRAGRNLGDKLVIANILS